jgi:dihydroxyacetone kinase-like predicted kinase
LGAERAYHSVVEPVEGTMLTVARAAAEAARRSAQHNRDLFVVWTDILVAAAAAQANTPELLPVLKQAGVTDSGGQGLLYLLEGGLRLPLSLMDEARFVSTANSPSAGAQAQASACGPTGPAASPEQSTAKLEHLMLDDSANGPDYGCDVQFLVYGRRFDLERMRADLEMMGQSILVVGDERLARVHAHVADPLLPLRYGAGLGLVADIVVEDMAAQARAWANRDMSRSSPLNLLPPPASKPITTLAVAPGPGFVELLQRLGVDQVLLRDPRLPLADEALLDCLSRIQAGSLLAAPESLETGALLRRLQLPAGQKLAVLPTQTIAQALAAMLAFNDRLDLDANIARMSRASRQVHTLEIGPAEREVIPELLAQTELAAYEIAAIYVGQDSSPEQAGVLGRQIQALCPDLEIELYHGGQPHVDYIISLE